MTTSSFWLKNCMKTREQMVHKRCVFTRRFFAFFFLCRSTNCRVVMFLFFLGITIIRKISSSIRNRCWLSNFIWIWRKNLSNNRWKVRSNAKTNFSNCFDQWPWRKTCRSNNNKKICRFNRWRKRYWAKWRRFKSSDC